jgi:hypothetical protein
MRNNPEERRSLHSIIDFVEVPCYLLFTNLCTFHSVGVCSVVWRYFRSSDWPYTKNATKDTPTGEISGSDSDVCRIKFQAQKPTRESSLTHSALNNIFFISQNIAFCPKTFSNRVWQSLLMECRRYIQWYGSYLSSITIDWFGLLILEIRSHNDAPQSVRLFWTSDQLVAETSTWQHTQQTNVHAPGAIRTHDLSGRAAADLSLRPRGHWDRQLKDTRMNYSTVFPFYPSPFISYVIP